MFKFQFDIKKAEKSMLETGLNNLWLLCDFKFTVGDHSVEENAEVFLTTSLTLQSIEKYIIGEKSHFDLDLMDCAMLRFYNLSNKQFFRLETNERILEDLGFEPKNEIRLSLGDVVILANEFEKTIDDLKKLAHANPRIMGWYRKQKSRLAYINERLKLNTQPTSERIIPYYDSVDHFLNNILGFKDFATTNNPEILQIYKDRKEDEFFYIYDALRSFIIRNFEKGNVKFVSEILTLLEDYYINGDAQTNYHVWSVVEDLGNLNLWNLPEKETELKEIMPKEIKHLSSEFDKFWSEVPKPQSQLLAKVITVIVMLLVFPVGWILLFYYFCKWIFRKLNHKRTSIDIQKKQEQSHSIVLEPLIKYLKDNYLKDMYKIDFRNTSQNIEGLDSFTYNKFIGFEEDIKGKGGDRTFLFQIKHPTQDRWYRVYVDYNIMEDFPYDGRSIIEEGGYYIRAFDSKPEIKVFEDVKAHHEELHEQELMEIIFQKLKHLPDLETIEKRDDTELHFVISNISSKIKDDEMRQDVYHSAREQIIHENHYEYYYSHILGYPIWEQLLEIEEGFSINDFLFQIESYPAFSPILNDLYVFEKDNKFSVILQTD